MRVVIQRVSRAVVRIDETEVAAINKGLLILVGIEDSDSKEDASWLSGKISRLRIFPDKDGVMNHSICEAGGQALVVSQFTLHAYTKKGNRPSYIRAAHPETAIPLYEYFISQLKSNCGKDVKSGVFGAMMKIELINDGPVTLIIDTKNKE
jgi:D-tyrosyl-tRNA(Tyr) deacylase